METISKDTKMGYYPHIDGLRAFAVLAVLVYHAFPSVCPGGFMGVDVFFVISGYLITLGLMNDLSNDKYSIKRFYVKRIRRILPAYFAAVFFAAIVACIVFYGKELIQFSETALSSGVFLTNIYFTYHSDYFSANAHENALLNLWSLSVEEQFYVLFPIFLALLYKWIPKRLKVFVWLAFIASLALSIYSVNVSGAVVIPFYWLPFRAWELLAGSLLAIHRRQYFVSSRWSVAALFALCGSFFVVSTKLPFPGAVAMLPVACAVIILLSGAGGYAKNILAHPVTVFIGKISYSLYLFHWPLLVFCRSAAGREIHSSWIGICALVLSFVISVLSWKYIETPIRKTHWQPRWYFVFASAVVGLVIVLYMAVDKIGNQQIKNPVVLVESEWSGEKAESVPQSEKFQLETLGRDENAVYCLWGDSHAHALTAGLHYFSQKSKINGVYIHYRATLARHINYAGSFSVPDNAESIETVLQYLRGVPQLKTVVLANRWACTEAGTWNEGSGYWYPVRVDGKKGSHTELFDWGLRDLCQELRSMGKRVVIIASVPEQGRSIPKELVRFAGITGRAADSYSLPLLEYQARQRNVVNCFRSLEESHLADVIWCEDVFYPAQKPIPLHLDSKALYIDDDHLSPSGARFFVDHRMKQLMKLLSP